jgi:MFS family permease
MLVATGFGITNAVDNPTRQAFVPEMVGPDSIGNAVSLNSVMVNAARAIGPAVAGVLIVTAGVGGCFLINAASFIAILVALATMNTSKLHPVRAAAHRPGQLLPARGSQRSRSGRCCTPQAIVFLIATLLTRPGSTWAASLPSESLQRDAAPSMPRLLGRLRRSCPTSNTWFLDCMREA